MNTKAEPRTEWEPQITATMRRYHDPEGEGHPIGDYPDVCAECEDIVGMFLAVERAAVERDRATAARSTGHDTRGRCNDKTFRDGHSWTCPCHPFRRAVPVIIEGVDEGDLLGELRAIHATLRSIEAWLHELEEGS